MITLSEPALEAAARAIFTRQWGEAGIGHGLDSRAMDDCRSDARAAITAYMEAVEKTQ